MTICHCTENIIENYAIMIMKAKMILSTVAAAVFVLLTGCKKEGIDSIRTSYTYKTSGSVTLVASELAKLTPEQIAAYKQMGGTIDTVTIAMTPEQGQMNVAVKDKSKKQVIVTWNDILGNVSTAEASVDGSNIKLESSAKSIQLTDGTQILGGGFVTFGGEGTQYDNILIIPMKYKGEVVISEVYFTIIDSNVQCVAKVN